MDSLIKILQDGIIEPCSILIRSKMVFVNCSVSEFEAMAKAYGTEPVYTGASTDEEYTINLKFKVYDYTVSGYFNPAHCWAYRKG